MDYIETGSPQQNSCAVTEPEGKVSEFAKFGGFSENCRRFRPTGTSSLSARAPSIAAANPRRSRARGEGINFAKPCSTFLFLLPCSRALFSSLFFAVHRTLVRARRRIPVVSGHPKPRRVSWKIRLSVLYTLVTGVERGEL